MIIHPMRHLLLLMEGENDQDDDGRIDIPGNKRFGSLMRYLDNSGHDFAVIGHDRSRHEAARPLVVVVHPGDMIESMLGWDNREEGKAATMFWGHNSIGTSRELAEWRKRGADFVVLHRISCEQFPEKAAWNRRFGLGKLGIWAEIQDGHRRGTVLFGDNLERAANWMIRNLHIADRPHIFLAGAYSDPVDGCLTYIGRALERVVGADRISVSKFSPPGNAPGTVWRPGGKVEQSHIDDTIMPGLRAQIEKAKAAS